MVREIHRILLADERGIVSSAQIAELRGILNTLLVIYLPEKQSKDQPTEARKPVRAKPEHWWQKFI